MTSMEMYWLTRQEIPDKLLDLANQWIAHLFPKDGKYELFGKV